MGSRAVALLALAGVVGLGGCAHEQALGRKWVKSLEVKGNRHVKTADVKDAMATQKTGWWWPFARKKYFETPKLKSDLERITALYKQRGYYDARVEGGATEETEDWIKLRVVVREGEATRITSVKLEGLERLPERLRRRLHRRLGLKPGQIFDYGAYEAAKQRLLNILKRRGYYYAEAEGKVEVDRDRRTAAVRLDYSTGPVVRVGSIVVVGNDGIPAGPIKRRLVLYPGDRVTPKRLAQSEARIYDLGVFGSVRLKLPERTQERVEVTVEVVPAKKLREIRLGGGIGIESQRDEVRLRFEWLFRNFLGGMRTLRLRLRPAWVWIPSIGSQERQGFAGNGDVTFEQPDLFNWDVTLDAEAGYEMGVTEAYDYRGPRGAISLQRGFWRQRVIAGVGYDLRWLTFSNIDEAAFNPATTPLGPGFKNPYLLTWLNQSLSLDLRDNRTEPRRGAYFLTRAEEAAPWLGSKFSYLKLWGEARGYVPLGRRITFAARALLGWLKPWGDMGSPITQRFYLGGPSDHRGFSFRRLAPQVYDEPNDRYIPVGGDGEVLFSGEFRIRLLKIAGQWLSIVPFVDAGDVVPRFKDLDLGRLHVAVGGDLVYATPIGPVRAGVGVRLNRLDGLGPNGLPNPDPGQRFSLHISIGEAF